MCRVLKTLVNEDIFRIKDVDECLNENIVGACEKRYSNEIDESQPWICQTCGCSNPTRRSGSMMCRQCGTQRGNIAVSLAIALPFIFSHDDIVVFFR